VRRSYLLILIVLVALLSAATSVGTLPPHSSNRHRTTHPQAHSSGDKHEITPQPHPMVTVIVQQIPAKEAQRITAIIQEQPYKHWWKAPNAPEWALFILTIPYVVVSVGLFWMTWKAADAAKEAADATYLTVVSSRPYLLPESIAFGPNTRVFNSGIKWPPHDQGVEIPIPAPTITFKNHGRSAAIVSNIMASLAPVEFFDYDPKQQGVHERLKGGLFNEITIFNRFIAPDRLFSIVALTKLTQGWTITREQFQRMRSLEWALVAYGRIEYRDTFGSKSSYRTDFCWIAQLEFEATADESINFVWIDGPEEHNRYT
jgi:hypothetical protein